MLTLTTNAGHTITAESAVQLASLWADLELGTGWDDGASPYDVHTTVNEYVDAVREAQAGYVAGYSVTGEG